MALDTIDVTILVVFSFAVGLLIGLMLGIPLASASRHWHRYRTHSPHAKPFSPLKKIGGDSIEVVLARVEDNAARHNRIDAAVGVENGASAISSSVQIDHQVSPANA